MVRRTPAQVRARRWTARPARPVTYWPGARVLDALSGRTDGRRGLPDAADDGPARSPATQRTTEVLGVVLGAIAGERLRLRTQEEQLKAARNDARTRLEGAVEQVEKCRTRYREASVPPPDDEFRRRRLGEADLPETEIRRRRAAEHDRSLAAVEGEYSRARREELSARHDLELMDEALSTHAAVGRIRELRLREHGRRRSALYWRHLLRVHPEGRRLNDRLQPVGPNLPAWAKEPGADDERRPGGPRT
jgi:hypothetical protein